MLFGLIYHAKSRKDSFEIRKELTKFIEHMNTTEK